MSCDELLLVCEVCKQDVLIFGADEATVTLQGPILGHDSEQLVLVALDMHDAQGRVRTHFRRLLLQEAVL